MFRCFTLRSNSTDFVYCFFVALQTKTLFFCSVLRCKVKQNNGVSWVAYFAQETTVAFDKT